MKGFKADLVMLNQSANDYLNPVRDKLHELVQASHARDIMNMPGGVFLLEADHVGGAVSLLITAAAVVLKAEQPFMQQILFEENIYPHKLFTGKKSKVSIKRKNRRYHILENGLGGFIQGGRNTGLY